MLPIAAGAAQSPFLLLGFLVSFAKLITESASSLLVIVLN